MSLLHEVLENGKVKKRPKQQKVRKLYQNAKGAAWMVAL